MTDDERRRLYDEVWAEPMVVVAKRYGLSDVGMAKLCRRAQIPVPPRGYWARLRSGKAVRRPALPQVGENALPFISLPRVRRQAEQEPPEEDTEVLAALQREKSPSFRIDPGAELQPHRVVTRVEGLYRAAHADEYGMLALRAHRQVARVSRECLSRALRVLNLFCHACEARGWRLRLEGDPGYEKAYGPTAPLRVEALGHSLEVTLDEASKRATHPPPVVQSRGKTPETFPPWRQGPRQEYEPTGLLAITVEWRGERRRLSDRPDRLPIETRLNHFCAKVVEVAAVARADAARKERELRKRDASWREHEEREHLRQFQTQIVGDLQAQAALWAKHRQIAAYIAAVREAYAGEPHLTTPDQPLGRWLAWADAHVAQMDPRRHRKLDPENPPPLVRQLRPPNW